MFEIKILLICILFIIASIIIADFVLTVTGV